MKTPAELMEMVEAYVLARCAFHDMSQPLTRQMDAEVKSTGDALRTALTAHMGWKGMESAPKDGTRVILSWGWKSMVGYYLDNTATASPWAGWKPPSMEPWPQGQPNAWMPLPPPPEEGTVA